MDFKKLFGLEKAAPAGGAYGALFEGIESILKGSDEPEVKRVCGIAGLLGKVAYADMDTSGAELQRIRSILTGRMKVSTQQAEAILLVLDREHARLFSIEDYIYTRLVNEVCEKEEKQNLLAALFEVASADDTISAEEDGVLWSIAKGMHLSHKEFVTVKREFKEYLGVLK